MWFPLKCKGKRSNLIYKNGTYPAIDKLDHLSTVRSPARALGKGWFTAPAGWPAGPHTTSYPTNCRDEPILVGGTHDTVAYKSVAFRMTTTERMATGSGGVLDPSWSHSSSQSSPPQPPPWPAFSSPPPQPTPDPWNIGEPNEQKMILHWKMHSRSFCLFWRPSWRRLMKVYGQLGAYRGGRLPVVHGGWHAIFHTLYCYYEGKYESWDSDQEK